MAGPTFTSDFIGFLLGPFGLPATVMFLVWLAVSLRGAGKLRTAGLTLEGVLVVAIWWAYSAWKDGSNIWPLPVILWSALALGVGLIAWVLSIIGGRARRHSQVAKNESTST